MSGDPTHIPPALLELKEYSYAHTEAAQRRPAADREQHIRTILWIHRFDVYTFLLSNGVAIPLELISDQANPRPGRQTVDGPAPRDHHTP